MYTSILRGYARWIFLDKQQFIHSHFYVAGVPKTLPVKEPGLSLQDGVAQTFLHLLGPFLAGEQNPFTF